MYSFLLRRVERKKDQGQSLVEYGLILALILVVCAGALGGLGENVNAAIGAARDAF